MLLSKYVKKNDNNLICTICSHYCNIKDGKTGICGIRKNIDGQIFATTYGFPCAISVDPIEKKPLYYYLPNTKTLSYATIGCNFSCKFCQNHSISQAKTLIAPFGKILPEKMIHLAQEYKTPSITATYTEPTVFLEYNLAIMRLAKKEGIKNIWVSNGYFSEETFKTIEPYLDAINIDFKSINSERLKCATGAKVEPVLESIERVFKSGIHIELTTLIIPGFNDFEVEIKSIAQKIASISKEIPWHISRFFPRYKWNNLQITPIETLQMAEIIGKESGLINIHIGNV